MKSKTPAKAKKTLLPKVKRVAKKAALAAGVAAIGTALSELQPEQKSAQQGASHQSESKRGNRSGRLEVKLTPLSGCCSFDPSPSSANGTTMISTCLRTAKFVGRIYKANAAPVGSPWMWTLVFWHHEGRSPTHGYAATREAAMAACKSWRRK
jgi:hypothetical protein